MPYLSSEATKEIDFYFSTAEKEILLHSVQESIEFYREELESFYEKDSEGIYDIEFETLILYELSYVLDELKEYCYNFRLAKNIEEKLLSAKVSRDNSERFYCLLTVEELKYLNEEIVTHTYLMLYEIIYDEEEIDTKTSYLNLSKQEAIERKDICLSIIYRLQVVLLDLKSNKQRKDHFKFFIGRDE